jgi:DNA sulfur modification protein DndB
MLSNYYTFSSLRGKQGKNSYYLIQCPLQLVSRLFSFDEVKATGTGFRYTSLSATKIEKLEQYLESHKDNYVLTPLIAHVESAVLFDPTTEHGDIGLLHIPLTASLVVREGQHRCAAIQQAIAENPELGLDTISIMLIPASDSVRKAEVGSALNYTQAKSNWSLRVLHDQESSLAELTKQIIECVPLFQNRIELKKTTISNRSTAIFTLSAVYQATKALLGYEKNHEITSSEIQLVRTFWQRLSEIISEWQKLHEGVVTAAYLRENYVHAHTVTLVAIGMAGNSLIQLHPNDWLQLIEKLRNLDWSRKNVQLWEGRAMLQGRMSKAHRSMYLTANALKQTLGIALNEKEQTLEMKLMT